MKHINLSIEVRFAPMIHDASNGLPGREERISITPIHFPRTIKNFGAHLRVIGLPKAVVDECIGNTIGLTLRFTKRNAIPATNCKLQVGGFVCMMIQVVVNSHSIVYSVNILNGGLIVHRRHFIPKSANPVLELLWSYR